MQTVLRNLKYNVLRTKLVRFRAFILIPRNSFESSDSGTSRVVKLSKSLLAGPGYMRTYCTPTSYHMNSR